MRLFTKWFKNVEKITMVVLVEVKQRLTFNGCLMSQRVVVKTLVQVCGRKDKTC